MNWKVYVACKFNCCTKHEGLLKVTGSHVHCKSGSISEMVQDSHCYHRVTHMAYSIAPFPMTLSDVQGHSKTAISNAIFRTVVQQYGPSVIDELLVRWTRVTQFHLGITEEKHWHQQGTRKPRKGAAVIATSMHGFANCRKFKSPVIFTLTLDQVKVTSTYTVHVGLPARPIAWL